MRRALITGVTGQDGAYLAQHLLSEGYDVFGCARSVNQPTNLIRLGIAKQIHLDAVDITDPRAVGDYVKATACDEIFHLAAMTNVAACIQDPGLCDSINVGGTENILAAARMHSPRSHVFFASSSAIFGNAQQPLTETAPIAPSTPYGKSKAEAHQLCHHYRTQHDLFVGVGILFNHESPLRGAAFLSGKIAAAFRLPEPYVELGNLDAQRDWGYAPDYVSAMTKIIRHSRPDDFVIATGTARSVRDFVLAAARSVGLSLNWTGSGADETAHDQATGRLVVKVNPDYFRPTEPTVQLGDASKAHQALGWTSKTTFDEMVHTILTEPSDRRQPPGNATQASTRQ
jgi:GDPmannose 4,6-dehydratase